MLRFYRSQQKVVITKVKKYTLSIAVIKSSVLPECKLNCRDVHPEGIKMILEEGTWLVSPVLNKTLGVGLWLVPLAWVHIGGYKQGYEPEISHTCILFCLHGDYLKGELGLRVWLSGGVLFFTTLKALELFLWSKLKNWLVPGGGSAHL